MFDCTNVFLYKCIKKKKMYAAAYVKQKSRTGIM